MQGRAAAAAAAMAQAQNISLRESVELVRQLPDRLQQLLQHAPPVLSCTMHLPAADAYSN